MGGKEALDCDLGKSPKSSESWSPYLHGRVSAILCLPRVVDGVGDALLVTEVLCRL